MKKILYSVVLLSVLFDTVQAASTKELTIATVKLIKKQELIQDGLFISKKDIKHLKIKYKDLKSKIGMLNKSVIENETDISNIIESKIPRLVERLDALDKKTTFNSNAITSYKDRIAELEKIVIALKESIKFQASKFDAQILNLKKKAFSSTSFALPAVNKNTVCQHLKGNEDKILSDFLLDKNAKATK